jgi:hypothetical protein
MKHTTRRNTIGSRARWLALLAALLLPTAAGSAETVDPDDDDSQWAWGENIGWLDAEPQGDGGPGVETTWEDLEGWLWSENAGWVSTACENTSSCGDVDYGIDVETIITNPSVEFRAWAWAENLGWISTACENTDSCGEVDYGVEIEVGTGDLIGWAWSENAGWISMRCEETDSCGDVDYGVTIGPCPEVTGFVPNPVPVGTPVTIQGNDLAESGHELKPRVFYDDVAMAPLSQITTYDETMITWAQTLSPGTHFIRVQHQNGCLSFPSPTLVVVPASFAPPPPPAGPTSCGLLGIETIPLLAGFALLRRRRALKLERTR